LLTQILFAGFLIWLPIALPLGLVTKTSPPPPLSLATILTVVGWAILALVCAWGLIRNRWWAYFGEVAVLCALAAAFIYLPESTSGSSRTRPEVIPWSNQGKLIMGVLVFVTTNWSLIKRGTTRRNEVKAASSSAGF
jgi:hypothetical protein